MKDWRRRRVTAAVRVTQEAAMFEQIVVGTDGSTGANIAVDAAIELARA